MTYRALGPVAVLLLVAGSVRATAPKPPQGARAETAAHSQTAARRALRAIHQKMRASASRCLTPDSLTVGGDAHVRRVVGHSVDGWLAALRQAITSQTPGHADSSFCDSFETHVRTLLESGRVSPDTAKVFIGNLDRIPNVDHAIYRAILEPEERPSEAKWLMTQAQFDATGNELARHHDPSLVERADGWQYFYRANPVAANVTRLYVQPDLGKSPQEVLRRFHESVRDAGLSGNLHFKFLSPLDRRRDTIVAYGEQGRSHVFEQLLRGFLAATPPELLAQQTLPHGVRLARGVTLSDNAARFSALYRYLGWKTPTGKMLNLAYTELIAALVRFSDSMAYAEHGSKRERIRLDDAAAPFFEQLLRLSGINPETMFLPVDGAVPPWVTRIQRDFD